MTATWILPDIDVGACTRCGRCAEDCPTDAVAVTGAGPTFVRPQACTYCGLCEDVCPVDAISLTYTIEWGGDQAA